MRTYLYNDENAGVYTEREMMRSRSPRCRFHKLGQFKNRRAAFEYARIRECGVADWLKYYR